jgi:hypothetical protein
MKALSTDGFMPIRPPASLGPATSLQWVPLEQLVIDPSYQREMGGAGRKNVRAIAAEFSWAYFAPLMVSPIEGGRYAIIDGQHRATAAMLLGIKQVPCAVVIADQVTQAAAFHAVNAKTTRMHTVQIFHARVAAGDERALVAKRVMDAAGVEILRRPGAWRHTPTKTIAVGAIEDTANRNAEAAIVTLRLIRRANEFYTNSFLRSCVIQAVFEILCDRQDWMMALDKNPEPFLSLELETLWAKASVANAQIRGTTINDQLQALLIDELELAMRRRAA